MAKWFYMTVWGLGWPAFYFSAAPTMLHRERARQPGGYILAPTHFSPYDIPCLMRTTPRVLDFVGNIEVFANPWLAWFFRRMGAVALDRRRPGVATLRTIVDRLEQGHVVVMFPEGNIRTEQTSVINGGTMKPGIGRIAHLVQAPIIPCVIIRTQVYRHSASWLPLRRTRYGANYGLPITVGAAGRPLDEAALAVELRQVYRKLYEELTQAMDGQPPAGAAPTGVAI